MEFSAVTHSMHTTSYQLDIMFAMRTKTTVPFLVRDAMIVIILAGISGCIHFESNSGPVDEVPSGLTRLQYTIPVRLRPGGLTYKAVGTLTYRGDPAGTPLLLLLSGGGYGPVYFDFPYQPETYSFVRAAADEGYSTFNLSRIGIGPSSRPPGRRVDTDSNAYVVHQVTEALRNEERIGTTFGPLVTVGHSMGSVMAVAHAVTYPDDIDGIILTGMLHNTNPTYTEQVRDRSKPAIFDRRFFLRIWDFTYFTSKPGMRNEMFYYAATTDPDVVAADEATRETLTLGEIITVARFDGQRTLDIQVPTLIVNGDRDFTSCGGKIDCADISSVVEYENRFFSPAADLEVYLPKDTGHVVNLHRTAPETYRTIAEWLDRKIVRLSR